MGQAGDGDAHNFAADFVEATNGGHRPGNVEGIFVDHRLHHDRMAATDRNVAHLHGAGLATMDRGVKQSIV